MLHRRLLLIGGGAVLAAALLTVVTYRALLARITNGVPQLTSVVVAAHDVPVGAMLSAADVKVVAYPAGAVPQGAITSATTAVGRGVVASMSANEAVLEGKLAPKDAGAGLPAMIPPNMRAVSVQVNDVIAVAGFVIPGTHVDVLVTGSPQGGNTDTMTTTVLENVEVLAAGQKIQPNAEGKPEKVPVITLLVSPEDAQKLTLASTEGKIQLALRNPLDRTRQDTATVKTASLYRLPQAPAPEPVVKHMAAHKAAPAVTPVAAPYTVEVIRGDKRDATKFSAGTEKE